MRKIRILLIGLIAISLIFGAIGCQAGSQGGDNPFTVVAGEPNPDGNIDELYLLKYQDDVISGEITGFDESIVELPQATLSEGDSAKLRIFHFNDMHHHIADYSKKGDFYGLAQMKLIVDKNKADNIPTLFISAGDDHIGTIFDELVSNKSEEFITSPAYESYSKAGLDFSVLGNHEFDKQSAILEKMLGVPKFSVLSATITNSQFDLDYFPAAIAVVDDVRVGIVGITTDTDSYVHTLTDPDLAAHDPLETVKNIIPALEKEVDVVIVLSHIGYNVRGGDADTQEKSRYKLAIGDAELAMAVGEITDKPAVIVGGHTHTVLNLNGLEEANVYKGVPVVQAGQYASHLGEVNIEFKVASDFNISAILHPTLPAHSKKEDAILQTEADYDVEFQDPVIGPLREEVEKTMLKPLAIVSDNQDLSDEVTVVDRYTGESAIANFMNDAVVERSSQVGIEKLDFAVFNATGLRGITPGKEITYADWYNVMPYADTIVVFEFTGAQLKELLNDNAKRIYRTDELFPIGENNPEGFLERGFLHFSKGIRYKIKLGATNVENEAFQITLNGKDIDEVLGETYRIAFNSYLSAGRGGWDGEAIGNGLPDTYKGMDLTALDNIDTYLVYRNEIISYINDGASGMVNDKSGALKDGRLDVVE